MSVQFHSRKSRLFNLTHVRGDAGDIHKESFGTLDDMMFRQGEMVPHKFILAVTSGSWRVYYPRTGEELTIQAGQGPALNHRIGRSKIEAMEDRSEMLCMRPIDMNQWWGREGINLAPGQPLSGDHPEAHEAAYVIWGEVDAGGNRYPATQFVEALPGIELNIEATEETRVIYLHLMDQAPETSR